MTTPQKKTEPGSGDTPSRRCVACEKPLPEQQALFCPYCQEPVAGSKPQPALRFCPGCGKEVASDYQYCPTCATEIPDTLTPWHERVDQAKAEALEADLYICHQKKEVMLSYQDLLVQQEIQVRAIRRAEYAGSLMTATEWFDALYEITDDYNSAFVVYGLLSGNYPDIVSAQPPYNAIPLMKKTILLSLVSQAMKKGYLLPEKGDPSPVVLGRYAPVVLQYYKRAKHIMDEELTSLRFRFHYGRVECLLTGLPPSAYDSLSPESFHTLRTLDRIYRALRDGVLSSVEDRQEKPVSLLCGSYYLMLGSGTYSSHSYCQHCGGSGKLRTLIHPPAYKQAQQSALVVVKRTCPYCHSSVTPEIPFCSSCGGTIATQLDSAVDSAPKVISSRGLFCGKCGKQVQRPDAKHCEACGWRLVAIYRQEIVKGWNEHPLYCHCPSCGEKTYSMDAKPTYCEYCGSSLKIPQGTPGCLRYCHACGNAFYATTQHHCTHCGVKLSPRPARIQEPSLPSWLPSPVVVESTIVETLVPSAQVPCNTGALPLCKQCQQRPVRKKGAAFCAGCLDKPWPEYPYPQRRYTW